MNLYRGDGTIKTHYEYDSWGRMVSITDENGNPITAKDNIGHVNPIRYRGYYYDTDTGLYYLKSRYYDPELGRFLNCDNQIDTSETVTGLNVFAYCGNNPIVRIDPTGHSWWGDVWNWICEKTESALNTVCDTGKKIGKVFVAIGESSSVRFSSGYGLSVQGTVASTSVGAGFKYKYPEVEFKGGDAKLQSSAEGYLQVSGGIFEFGPKIVDHYYDDERGTKTESTMFRVKDTITVFGVELYAIYGFEFGLELHYEELWDKVVKIFEE